MSYNLQYDNEGCKDNKEFQTLAIYRDRADTDLRLPVERSLHAEPSYISVSTLDISVCGPLIHVICLDDHTHTVDLAGMSSGSRDPAETGPISSIYPAQL